MSGIARKQTFVTGGTGSRALSRPPRSRPALLVDNISLPLKCASNAIKKGIAANLEITAMPPFNYARFREKLMGRYLGKSRKVAVGRYQLATVLRTQWVLRKQQDVGVNQNYRESSPLVCASNILDVVENSPPLSPNL